MLDSLTRERKIQLVAMLAAKKQRLAKDSLIDFCQYTNPNYVADPIHYKIAQHLEAVLRGDIKRLMVFCGPQIGKSLLTSVNFPAWWLGNKPDYPIILASYAAELAEFHSRNARTVIESPLYQDIFPGTHTRQDSRAANRWNISGHSGGMRAVGVSGGIAGYPAGLLLIDDPVMGTEWAFSENELEKLWKRYQNDFVQRLWENAPIILTMTRWAEGDLAGRILNSADAVNWTVLRIPALSETQEERDTNNAKMGIGPGLPDPIGRIAPDITCVPSRYSSEYYLSLKNSGNEWRWSAIYQGVPHPSEGNEIKRSWFAIVPEAPRDVVTKIRFWDKAATENAGARTAGVLLSMDKQGIVYIEDVVCGQWAISERNAIMKQTAELDALRYVIRDPKRPNADPSILPGYNTVHTYIEQEPGSGGKESAELTIRDLAGYMVFSDVVSGQGSKEFRAGPFISYAAAGNVRLVRGTWNERWLDEAVSWPHGRFKDQIDATSGAFNKAKRGVGFGFGIAHG